MGKETVMRQATVFRQRWAFWQAGLLWQVLSLACWISFARAGELPGQVTSVDFTSDHRLLCENTRDVLTGGDPYPPIAWDRFRNTPITHTGSKDSRIKALVRLALGEELAGMPYHLDGVSEEPALCFRGEGMLPGDSGAIYVEGLSPLGPGVRTICKPIRWNLTIQPGTPTERAISLGTSGPHTVYVTLGKPRVSDDPRSIVTDRRMQQAIERIAAAQARVGTTASAPWLIYELMRQSGEAYVPARHYPRERAWLVPESWRLQPPGASCLSIVEFVTLVCNMAGIEGEVRPAAFYAQPEQPRVAIRGGLGDPPIRKKGAGDEPWQLFLTDDNNTAKGQLGGAGGMNYYEAALEFTWKETTYYYPAGTDRVYDSPDMVIRVFRTLAWAAYDYGRDAWIVREVIHTYTPPGQKQPESCPLPR
jgi:hypothetical protein